MRHNFTAFVLVLTPATGKPELIGQAGVSPPAKLDLGCHAGSGTVACLPMFPRTPLRQWLTAACLAALPLSATHALFDNSCLLFDIASRDHTIGDNWLSQSLFELSSKKMTASQIRNLHYSIAEGETSKLQTDQAQGRNYFLVDGEIRFIQPKEASEPAQPSETGQKAEPAAETSSPEAGTEE